MAGHSHAKNVKRIKEAENQKRSLVFSKMGKVISLAAKDGEEIEKNPALKTAIEKAKKMNLPKENIEKAIKKGSGELKNNFQEFLFEAYGPGKIALIIEGITDNINRTSAEIKKTISQYDGKIAETGSVKWMFEKRGAIKASHENDSEDLELIIIDSKAYDFKKEKNDFLIFTSQESLNETKNYLKLKGFEIKSSDLYWEPKSKTKINDSDKKKLFKLVSILEESEDVQKIHNNLE